jgi:hypothetical protein
MSRTSQPNHTASDAEDEFKTWWRSLWRMFAVQWTVNNLCSFLFIDRQIPQIVEFIEGGGSESSQYYVSIARRLADVERCPISECVPKLPWSVQHSVVVLSCFITQHSTDIKMMLAWYDLIWFGCSLEIIDIQFPIHYIPDQTKMLAEFNWSRPSVGKCIWSWSECDAVFVLVRCWK